MNNYVTEIFNNSLLVFNIFGTREIPSRRSRQLFCEYICISRILFFPLRSFNSFQ